MANTASTGEDLLQRECPESPASGVLAPTDSMVKSLAGEYALRLVQESPPRSQTIDGAMTITPVRAVCRESGCLLEISGNITADVSGFEYLALGHGQSGPAANGPLLGYFWPGEKEIALVWGGGALDAGVVFEVRSFDGGAGVRGHWTDGSANPDRASGRFCARRRE